ncbi:hypothetical protein LTS15_006122 [Exophiala xenobiotica]|nr:hypothetical protein LTS15_006122 [Exophiala xenobiotica]
MSSQFCSDVLLAYNEMNAKAGGDEETVQYTQPQFQKPTQPANTFHMDAEPAKTRIKFLSSAIFGARDKISQILHGREALLRKRWAKKTHEQRRRVLQSAWPDIPSRHRPDVQGILESLYPTKKSLFTPLEADAPYKWPHLNSEDLVQGQSLLLLLNSRGRNHPGLFAHADLASCRVGLLSGKIKTAWCPDGLMMLVGQDAPETYGAYIHHATNPYPFLPFAPGVVFGVGEGLLVLEVQQKLYEFLLECCGKIFSDVAWDELLDKQLPQQSEPKSIETTDASYVTLASVVAEAPFRVPATLDTDRLLRLVEAKRAAAEDHAWSIREDPGYFKHVLLARSLHRQEQIRDAKGNKCDSLNSKSFWNDVILDTLDSTYTVLLMWDLLYDVTNALSAKAPKGAGNFDYQKPQPRDVTHLIFDMLVVADGLAWDSRVELSFAVAASREVQERLVRAPHPRRASYKSGQPELCMKRKDRRPLKDDPLMRMFELLFDGDGAAIERVGIHPIVDEIQRIIQSDRRQAQRLSPFVADLFSDFALMTNICRVLEGLFPWTMKFDRKKEGLQSLDYPHLRLVNIARNTFEKGSEACTDACEACLPLPIKDSLDYPIHKVHSEQKVESLRRAEWNLDTFWNKWDHLFFSHTGETLNDFLRDISKGPRVIHRTLPYRPIERRKPTKPFPAVPAASITYLVPEPETPRRLAFEPPQAKIKTKGICNPPTDDVRDGINDDPEVTVPDAAEKSKEVTFKLKDRALEVFRTIFYTEDPNNRQGEVDWKDFLYAMTKVGFAAEKLYGSVWHFTPVEESEISRSFHVHQPHPETKIPHFMARNIGRRLTHTYGWTAQDFGKA